VAREIRTGSLTAIPIRRLAIFFQHPFHPDTGQENAGDQYQANKHPNHDVDCITGYNSMIHR
jgi:hypothetical protein